MAMVKKAFNIYVFFFTLFFFFCISIGTNTYGYMADILIKILTAISVLCLLTCSYGRLTWPRSDEIQTGVL